MISRQVSLRRIDWYSALVAALLAVVAGCSSAGDAPAAGAAATASDAAVELVVQFPDERKKQITVAWRESMTVLDVMRAKAADAGGLQLAVRGSGGMAFLDAIDGIANEGRTGKNWEYWINGEIGQLGIGAQTVRPRDAVLWKFEHFDYDRAQGVSKE